MARTQAVYYRDRNGIEPVNQFLDALESPAAQAAVDLQIGRLNGLDVRAPPLPFPHSSQVDGALRELRCRYGSALDRVLYRRSGNLFVLLHAISKHGRKLPEADKAVARDRWQDFEARMAEDPRCPPRALGHDAPRRSYFALLLNSPSCRRPARLLGSPTATD